MATNNEYITAAASYVGTKENTNKHHEIIDTYNKIRPLPRGYKMKYSDAWCAAFVSAIAYKTNVAGFCYECSAQEMLNAFKRHGAFSNTPQLGGLIFFNWDGGAVDHVGIIRRITANTVSTIEGNKNNAVGYRTINKNSPYIAGYATLNFSSESKPTTPTPTPTTPTATNGLNYLANMVICGKFGNGNARKDLIYNYVQANVNAFIHNKNVIDKNISDIVADVLAGKYGNGNARRENIYNAVQKIVNAKL